MHTLRSKQLKDFFIVLQFHVLKVYFEHYMLPVYFFIRIYHQSNILRTICSLSGHDTAYTFFILWYTLSYCPYCDLWNSVHMLGSLTPNCEYCVFIGKVECPVLTHWSTILFCVLHMIQWAAQCVAHTLSNTSFILACKILARLNRLFKKLIRAIFIFQLYAEYLLLTQEWHLVEDTVSGSPLPYVPVYNRSVILATHCVFVLLLSMEIFMYSRYNWLGENCACL